MPEKTASRAEKDYGLPRLTADEAARVLGAEPGTFWLWLIGELKPTPAQISKWRDNVPEVVIRLYLTRHAAHAVESPTGDAQLTPERESARGRRLQRRASGKGR